MKTKNKKIISWWSGGVTSAVTCKLCIDLYGFENVRIIFIDTFNEDDDTYRFKSDCEKWYGKEIETITGIGDKYKKVSDVWFKYNSLNVASGAVCSSELKRRVRELWERENDFDYQAFGFEIEEPKRAIGMKLNHSHAKPIFPLLLFAYSKKDCIKIIENAGITIPRMYLFGYKNNNCFKTGCVQGGIGYWQKIQREEPEKFDSMALIEHRLTDRKGMPVTMLKDQSKVAKAIVKETGIAWKQFIFLKPHPNYTELRLFSDMPPEEVKPLFECNGLCGINDLEDRSKTEDEINFE